ncbi:bifunctional DNA primase/polymerase [Ralstonia solanacearum]|uniref:Bifunctional DNA primase/polymerase n=1 Tax=Ralstonia solanacearum TaxID=305 RepID=A0AAW5ZUC0_RALSL|nr:bifunctional DNA primase/polymerase [Ralstonia solanacearum]MDB0573092.1 bifunctional DNA primase/polymerase [Ralstonia solanacearum]
MNVDLNLNEETQSVRDAAIALASRGWRVFPLHAMTGTECSCGKPDCHSPAKHPITKHGFKDASTDIAKIENWFGPGRNANVGIATGTVSALFVLDIDPCNGGDESFKRLCQEYGELPPTPTVCTGGDGTHYYFRLPDGACIKSSASQLDPGLDVRGEGGYVVAPPSTHVSSKQYRWASGRSPKELPLAMPPEWLVKRICHKPLKSCASTPAGWAKILEEGVSEGGRNTTATRLAGYLFRRGHLASVVLAILRLANARNHPPLPDAELETIVLSIAQRELNRKARA